MSKTDFGVSRRPKVSEVFQEYSMPFLIFALEDTNEPTIKQLNDIMNIPFITWNAYHVQQKNGIDKINYNEWLRSLIKDFPEAVKQMIDLMILRRKNEFAEYDYMIGAHEFYIDDKTKLMRFRAEARR